MKVPSRYLDFKGSRQKRKLVKKMKREIRRFRNMKHTDRRAYPEDWTADKAYREELRRRGKRLPESPYTQAYRHRFGRDVDGALRTKARESGVSFRILKKVYNRGLAAWRTGHRPGVRQHQWAMGRVNSFLVGGKARQIDKDLWKKVT